MLMQIQRLSMRSAKNIHAIKKRKEKDELGKKEILI